MKILFNDILQKTACPPELKSPALADEYYFDDTGRLEVHFDRPSIINCVGIGNFKGEYITFIFKEAMMTINGGAAAAQGARTVIDGGNAQEAGDTVIDGNYTNRASQYSIDYKENGLYMLGGGITAGSVEITAPPEASVGRIAMGKAVTIPTSIAKEPGFNSTAEPRTTLSGQVIPGAGGYNYRTLSLDSRYKTGPEAFAEIEAGYNAIGAGYPFFIELDTEYYKLPFNRFYATENNQRSMKFEGGVRRFLYSRRWFFTEAF